MSSFLDRSGVHSRGRAGRKDRSSRWRESGLTAVLCAFWLLSLIRVLGAALRREVFGVEATLAFMAVIAVPLLLVRAPRRSGEGAWPSNREAILRVHAQAARDALERGDASVAIGHCRTILEASADAVTRKDCVRLLAYAYATSGAWGKLIDLIESGAPRDLGDGDLERYERAARELGRARDAGRIAVLRAQRGGA